MESTHLRIESLVKRFGTKTAVDGVSLDVAPGSLVALLGPSGCGKSSCLRMIAGLIKPTSGEIYLNGKQMSRVPVNRRNIGMLFQNYALFPHMTVADNVAFGLEIRGIGKQALRERVQRALALVRLEEYGERLPAELSGGQQQRVALARAVVIEPSMLLLDEPLGALDKGLRENMQIELRQLQQRLGLTTVMVTHDQDEALTMADQIVVMRDGVLEQVGTAEDIYQRPASRFVANFIGASNLFVGKVEQRALQRILVTASGQQLTVGDHVPGDRDITVSVRPESISLQPLESATIGVNALPAQVDEIAYRGFMTQYHLRLENGERLVAFLQNQRTDVGRHFSAGDRVLASWHASSNHVLSDTIRQR